MTHVLPPAGPGRGRPEAWENRWIRHRSRRRTAGTVADNRPALSASVDAEYSYFTDFHGMYSRLTASSLPGERVGCSATERAGLLPVTGPGGSMDVDRQLSPVAQT